LFVYIFTATIQKSNTQIPDGFYTLYYSHHPCPHGLISRRNYNTLSNYGCIKVIIIQIRASLRSNSLKLTQSFCKNPYISSNSLLLNSIFSIPFPYTYTYKLPIDAKDLLISIISTSQILFPINFRMMLNIYSLIWPITLYPLSGYYIFHKWSFFPRVTKHFIYLRYLSGILLNRNQIAYSNQLERVAK